MTSPDYYTYTGPETPDYFTLANFQPTPKPKHYATPPTSCQLCHTQDVHLKPPTYTCILCRLTLYWEIFTAPFTQPEQDNIDKIKEHDNGSLVQVQAVLVQHLIAYRSHSGRLRLRRV